MDNDRQGAGSGAGDATATVLAMRHKIEEITLPLRHAVARRLVAGCTEKRGGVDPVIHFQTDDGRPLRVGDVPISLFRANECGDRYDGTVDAQRAAEYAARDPATAPPVVAMLSVRSGELNIIDGGHRISAARARGDETVRAITVLPRATPLVSDAPSDATDLFPILCSLRGVHSGQQDYSMTIYADSQPVGRLDYSVYKGVPAIQMIEVEPGARRLGHATRLLCELQLEFPLNEIDWGMLTEEGEALRSRLPMRTFPESGVLAGRQRLASMRRERARLLEAARAEPGGSRPCGFTDMMSKLNELHDAIDDLEDNLAGRPTFRSVLDIDHCQTALASRDLAARLARDRAGQSDDRAAGALPFMMIVGGHAIVFEPDGKSVLPEAWTGVCVDSRDATSFWHIGREGRERSYSKLKATTYQKALVEAARRRLAPCAAAPIEKASSSSRQRMNAM